MDLEADETLKISGLWKKYATDLRASMKYGLMDSTRDFFGVSSHSETLRRGEFWALQDVSFALKRGQKLGIIGPNGSGKSTLLKLINGIIRPDKGQIASRGRVGALIEVGAGFHPMLTGRENIFVNGSILGMGRSEIQKKFDSIVDFADIGDFLDVPVKNYSSGMYVRLGFAIAIHCRPEILLIDEVLSVGDVAFQRKCFRFFEESVLRDDVTLIMVSHSIYAISRMCDSCLILHRGKPHFLGPSIQAMEQFQSLMAGLGEENDLRLDAGGNIRSGLGDVRVESIEFVDDRGDAVERISVGSPAKLRIVLRAKIPFQRCPGIYVQIHDVSNSVLVYTCVPTEICQTTSLKQGLNVVEASMESIHLMPGTYTLVCKVGGAGAEAPQDNLVNAGRFHVFASNSELYSTSMGLGLVYVPTAWRLVPAQEPKQDRSPLPPQPSA